MTTNEYILLGNLLLSISLVSIVAYLGNQIRMIRYGLFEMMLHFKYDPYK